MRETDDEFELEERRRKAQQREQQKEKSLRREEERARAGQSEQQLAHERAEQELLRLEKEAQSPEAKSWSQKKKEQKLTRFEEVLKDANMTNLEKNARKGAFDEALRTPGAGKTAGKPQTKWVAGHEELPSMDLRSGRDPYAQPDYSIYRRNPDGTIERLHVNLKANKLHEQSVARARATARYNTEQAISNARRLPQGEAIIINYARTPSTGVQETMLAEHFRPGSPISEVRFGSTAHKRSEYQAPAVPKTQAMSQKQSTKSAVTAATEVAVIAPSAQPENKSAAKIPTTDVKTQVESPPEPSPVEVATTPPKKGLPPKRSGGPFAKAAEAEKQSFLREQKRLSEKVPPVTPQQLKEIQEAVQRGDVQQISDPRATGQTGSRPAVRSQGCSRAKGAISTGRGCACSKVDCSWKACWGRRGHTQVLPAAAVDRAG
jgi:hypothetical protein